MYYGKILGMKNSKGYNNNYNSLFCFTTCAVLISFKGQADSYISVYGHNYDQPNSH